MKRKRLARIILVIAVVVVAGQLLRELPRDVRIRFSLGPDHRDVTEARIGYVKDGHEVKGVRFHYENGAPPTIWHTVELPPGRYDVEVQLRGPHLRRNVSRALTVPAEGEVRIDLFDEAFAAMALLRSP